LPGGLKAADFVWLALFGALAVRGPDHRPATISLLAGLGVVQLAEPRLDRLGGPALAVALKLVLCYALIGLTGGVTSSYYLVLLVPVVSAATSMGLRGTLLTTTLAALGGYLSFLLFLDWDVQFIPRDQLEELLLRVLFLFVIGFLTQRLAEANRVEARKYQAAAEELARANRSLRAAEAAVHRSERLAALGQLSAGLAHELRNPMGTIKASAELLAGKLPADDAVARELAGYISTEIDRTNSLITRFLEFARPLPLRRQRVEIHEVLDRAAAELGRHVPPFDVQVYKNYSPDVRPVHADGEWLERVFYNLLLNAAQAVAPGQAITLKTRGLDNAVEVAVIDRGAGIDKAQLENIFNPFFTTKPGGTGLGLAIVSKIVDEHGGAIAVESAPGEGSVFRVTLPAGADPEN
jgi:signal transduction histidine kinase